MFKSHSQSSKRLRRSSRNNNHSTHSVHSLRNSNASHGIRKSKNMYLVLNCSCRDVKKKRNRISKNTFAITIRPSDVTNSRSSQFTSHLKTGSPKNVIGGPTSHSGHNFKKKSDMVNSSVHHQFQSTNPNFPSNPYFAMNSRQSQTFGQSIPIERIPINSSKF